MHKVQPTHSSSGKPLRANNWLKTFVTGLIFYFVSVVLLFLTQNPNLFPTVVMIGSFLVPVTYVTFFYERRHLSNLSMSTTVIGFVYGGILGVLAASLLEPIFVRSANLTNTLTIGLIEEFAKILGVFILARRFRHDMEMDGLILGAAAGMGFAALESMGYAFTAFLSSGGSLSQTVFVTLIRGILSPVGHGTWTAIFASVLFREAKQGHFRINYKVIGAYVAVSILHASWDALPTFITDIFGPGLDVFLGQAFVGAIGLFALWLRYRDALRLQQAAESATATSIAVPFEPSTKEKIQPGREGMEHAYELTPPQGKHPSQEVITSSSAGDMNSPQRESPPEHNSNPTQEA
jgi:RsiW-degrading membrane proteinase PrsW (M82 family)